MDLQLILRIAAGIGIAIVAFFLLRLVFKVLGKAAKFVIILVLIGWILAFLIGFSSIVFYVLAGLFLLTAMATYLMGLTVGPEALKMAAAGFMCFITPHTGNALVGLIGAVSGRLMQFIMS